MRSDIQVEVVTVKTSGDQGNRDQLGAFVHEIQLALLDGRVDIGLHCLKDLPTSPVSGLGIAAYLSRDNPLDALISTGPDLSGLDSGAKIGTGSLRRSAQLLALKPSARPMPLIGNIDTRLRKLTEGHYDAIILALAGLDRMGGLSELTENSNLTVHPLAARDMVPCPGQGILVLESRSDAQDIAELCFALTDRNSAAAAFAERTFLGRFGAGCSLPIGAIATVDNGQVHLFTRVTSPNGDRRIEVTLKGTVQEAAGIGFQAAEEALSRGALDLIRESVPLS